MSKKRVILSSVGCEALPLKWNTVTTDVTFPVYHGTVLEVKCAQESHKITGSTNITCNTAQEIGFTFEKMPFCIREFTFVVLNVVPEYRKIKMHLGNAF